MEASVVLSQLNNHNSSHGDITGGGAELQRRVTEIAVL